MQIGALVIDWENRKLDWHGMDGCDNMAPQEVLSILADNANHPDREAWALIYWLDENQLCVHDAKGFEAELRDD